MLQMYQKYRTIADDFWKPCAHYVQNIMRTLHMFLFARNVRHSFQKSSANFKVLGQAASQACLQMMLHMNQKIFIKIHTFAVNMGLVCEKLWQTQ